MVVGDVIQFNQRHKWCGCFGIIEEVRHRYYGETYLVMVPDVDKEAAYIWASASEFELIGKAALVHA